MLLASTAVLGMNTAGLNDSVNDNRSHSPTKEISRSEESKEIEKQLSHSFIRTNGFGNNSIKEFLNRYKNRLPWSDEDFKSFVESAESRDEEFKSWKGDFDPSTNALLDFALRKGDLVLAEYSIKHGSDVNERYMTGETPLHIACESGNEANVKWLVEHGADINKGDIMRRTPLFFACKSGSESLAKYLIEKGAYAEKDGVSMFSLSLSFACESGNESLVRCLVEHGADVNGGHLHIACENGNEVIVKYLVEHGADVNEEDFFGETPLHIAREEGFNSIVEYLEQHGARH